jgi:DNA-3-methyladenine glycosylase
LLGKILIRKHKNGRLQAGLIVETESYHGFDDKACHGAKARTKRTEVIFGEGGRYYVYFIYGMYWNLNIVTGKPEFPSAILIRALEPLYDSQIDIEKLTFKEQFRLASGPGKLCRWMRIDKEFYGRSVEDEELFLIDAKYLFQEFPGVNPKKLVEKFEIIEAKRVGVDYAAESAVWDWRYYIKGNKYVSKL